MMPTTRTVRRPRLLITGASLATAGLVALAPMAQAVAGYHTSAAGVRVRSGASTATTQVNTITASGTAIDIACQTPGQTVTQSGFGTSPVWDRVPAWGGYISDLFVQETPYAQFDRRIPGCGRPSSAQSIGYNPFAANYSNQCTYYAEQRMKGFTGLYMPVYGNAYQWASQAAAAGWHVSSAPALSSVAVFPAGAFGSSVGHVAWVIDYNATSVRIQDYNWNFKGAVMTDHWVTVPAGTKYIYGDR
ncbi:MAG: CHAP domain-containing protein [Kineosporiaceae bacterium]|nr:CHAP domain-containing protein [Kineosporiaceae bacterium]MBK7623694.1 CHAP domain-containing protein [Kineosporiaceae bacterium]MBK8078039.1 CHAP domain-containing protein [Kineosporiaceae bacterium]